MQLEKDCKEISLESVFASPSSLWHISTQRCSQNEEGSAAREREALMWDLCGPGGTCLEACGQLPGTVLRCHGSLPAVLGQGKRELLVFWKVTTCF